MAEKYELKTAIKTRVMMEKYQDDVYLKIMKQLNSNYVAIMQEDLGTQFVTNCGRDLAGEVVRNCFNTADYNITVDQLAKRILEFSYENEYDPLSQNAGNDQITKNVLNYNELSSPELDQISAKMDANQTQLFTGDRKKDNRDRDGKSGYRKSKEDEKGDIYDELTGKKGDKTTYVTQKGTVGEKSTLQADHTQARESASVNIRYVSEDGAQELREFWNSPDNMQMMFQSANSSKGDVRVCDVNGKIKYVNARSKDYDPSTDITYKATPEQLADAVIAMWEKVDTEREQQNQPKIQNLKDKGYLDENGKVPKAVRQQLIKNIRHSQNVESKIVLKETNYEQVAKDAEHYTKQSIGKIIAGQVIYYSAPPLVYEVRTILQDKSINLENALKKLGASVKRVGRYVISKLKTIFINIAFNSLKKFIKSFMDILINLVKATVKKLFRIVKNLVLSIVDAVRIISNPNATRAQKADSVVNLFSVTITACVIEVMFEVLGDTLHIPKPFGDIILGPLQILTTVICTNLTMIILKKADLFNVQRGFRMTQIRTLFSKAEAEVAEMYSVSRDYADSEIKRIIEQARTECHSISDNLSEMNLSRDSVRYELEKINKMFSMGIDFDQEWLEFMGYA